MNKLLLATALAVTLLALRPADSKAYGNSPQCSQGFGWLYGKALNFMSFNHYHGPLYNYGPYNLGDPGYAYMYVPNPWCGHYVPAYPAAYYGGYVVPPGTRGNYLPPPDGAMGAQMGAPIGVQMGAPLGGVPVAANPSSNPTSPAIASEGSSTTAPVTTTSSDSGRAPGIFPALRSRLSR